MKRTLLIAACFVGIAFPVSAQTVKVDAQGNVTVVDKDGSKVTVNADDTVKVEDSKSSVTVKESSDKKTKKKAKSDKIVTADLKPRGPIVCAKNDDVELKNVHITGPTTIDARGNCDVEIKDSQIEATGVFAVIHGSADLQVDDSIIRSDGVGIQASGSSEIELDGVDLSAAGAALVLSGTAKVKVKNSKITGNIVVSGMAKFIDDGGNTITK